MTIAAAASLPARRDARLAPPRPRPLPARRPLPHLNAPAPSSLPLRSTGPPAVPTLSCLKSQAAALQDQYSELHARFQETLAAEVRWLARGGK